MIINCNYCGKQFEKKKSVFCSLACSKRRAGLFEKEQIDYIEARLQKVPPQDLINQFIERYQHSQYTHKQVQTLITRIAKYKNVSTVPCINVWGTSDFAKILNISYDRLDSWISRGLKTVKINQHQKAQKYIYLQDFNAFVLLKPHLFKGIKISNIRKITRNKKLLKYY